MKSVIRRSAAPRSLCCIAGVAMLLTNQTPRDSITIAELRDHLYFLASDYLGGRVTGTHGYEVAANYAVSQFVAAGLRPAVHDPDGRESFFQEVPLVRRGYRPGGTLVARKGDELDELAAGADFKLVLGGDAKTLVKPLEVAFVGYALQEPDSGWDDFEGLELEGKLAVAMLGAPTLDGEALMPPTVHQMYVGTEGWQRKYELIAGKRPAAILFLVDDEDTYEGLPHAMEAPHLQLASSAARQTSARSIGVLAVHASRAGFLFEDQLFCPVGEQASGLEEYRTFAMRDVDVELRFERFADELTCRNILGVVDGADQEVADEYVVVTAHLDHIPPMDGEICNGADDNASGCAGLLEIAEAVAMHPPRRSVLFVLFTGEDVGESRMGSKHFVAECPLSLDSIALDLNLDMIGRDDSYWPTGQGCYVMDAEKLGPELREVIEQVNEETVRLPISFHASEGGSSDDESFSEAGVPAFGLFSGAHEDLHKPSDEAHRINFERARDLAQLAFELTLRLADEGAPTLREH